MARQHGSRDERLALRSAPLRAARRALSSARFLEDAQRFTPSGHAGLASLRALPDLLHSTPGLWVDGPDLCGALDFAFAGGGCLDTLERLMDGSTLPPSDWRPESYVEDLGLGKLVSRCMEVAKEGWKAPINRSFVIRVLASPPSDGAVRDFRMEVLSELSGRDALREPFEKLYRLLCELRVCFALYEGHSRYEETRRRVEILTRMREILELAAGTFSDADSGLRRIHDFANEARSSEGYERLLELLTYENDLARVVVRLQLGVDGRVRKFQLVELRESEQNRFHIPPFRRLMSRVGMRLRGYRFSSDELVERWLDHVFEGVKHLLPPLFQLLGHMEVYLCALAFRDHCAAKNLSVCFPELVGPDDHDEGGRRVRGLFNPLLLAEDITPVPCDLEGPRFDQIHILTGPNSGGKTRLLQALGITQLLAQGGIFVPAREARLRISSGLFVSLVGVSEPRPEVGEGRLGTELIRIRRMFETSRPSALVILDEFCSGTNPSEGEEIFYLVLTLLGELRPEVFISTHFLEFTRRLSQEENPLDLAFLQVELDAAQRPTYGVGTGVAQTSLAAQTAARLGVTREELMELIRRNAR